MRFVMLVAVLSAVSSSFAMPAHATTPDHCKALATMDFGRIQDAPTRVMAANVVAAREKVPAYCKVEGYVSPQVGIELKLPLENWNEKFLFQGCGAMCGVMMGSPACDDGVARGYACATTDMGHRAPMTDGKWAYNNPLLEIDLGHRGTHVATLAGKAITKAFYNDDLAYAYFRGCSTGGRQGLVEAQRYPYDFDGIIAGSPVLYQPMGPPLHLTWGVTSNLDDQGNPIFDAAKLPALHRAVLAACDARDGLKDGLIDDPFGCSFDPASLQCAGESTDQCLTPAEVDVVRKFYEGPKGTGKQSFAPMGMMPGSELSWEGYFKGGKNAPSTIFATEALRYLAFPEDPGPTYEITQFDWARDPQRISQSHLSAANPDMSLFKKAGGKMILFHGLSDGAIMATTTTAFYDTITRTMGGAENTQDFARLYLPTGLNHCSGGDGLTAIDFLSALENWVERKQAPDSLVGYNVPNTQPNAALPIGFTSDQAAFARPIFPYPDRAVYDGSGDWKDPRNFKRKKGK